MILLDDLLHLEKGSVRFITPNEEGINPIDTIRENADAMSDWLLWKYKDRYFQVTDIAIGLVKYGEFYVLGSIQRITKELETDCGRGFEGVIIPEFSKYFGRVIVKYNRNHQQAKRFYEDIKDQLVVYEILPEEEKVF